MCTRLGNYENKWLFLEDFVLLMTTNESKYRFYDRLCLYFVNERKKVGDFIEKLKLDAEIAITPLLYSSHNKNLPNSILRYNLISGEFAKVTLKNPKHLS